MLAMLKSSVCTPFGRFGLLLLSATMLVTACADDKKAPKEAVTHDGEAAEKKDEGDAHVSAKRVTLTNSLSNNPLTSQTISDAKAEALLPRLESSKNKATLEGRISTERLAKKSAAQLMATAKKLAELEMEKGANRQISDDVKLDIALAAISSKNFSLAQFFLEDLIDSKDTHVRAGAHNAIGVIALRDERVPEAVAYFRQALKIVPNYRPALLNLGFAALKGGDLNNAKRALGEMQNDWFVQYGMISIARLEGNDQRADELCEKVLKKEANHKAALFNCGLVEAQNRRNFKKGIEYIAKAAKARGGELGWDERISMMETKIDQDEAKAKQQEARKKAAEKAAEKAEKAADKPGDKGPPADAKAAGKPAAEEAKPAAAGAQPNPAAPGK